MSAAAAAAAKFYSKLFFLSGSNLIKIQIFKKLFGQKSFMVVYSMELFEENAIKYH